MIESSKSSSSDISWSLPVSFSKNRCSDSCSVSGSAVLSSSSSGVAFECCLTNAVWFCFLASLAFDSAIDSGVSRRPEDSIRNVSGHLNFDLLPCLLQHAHTRLFWKNLNTRGCHKSCPSPYIFRCFIRILNDNSRLMRDLIRDCVISGVWKIGNILTSEKVS